MTNGQQGLFQVTANRALFTNLRNAAGTEVGTAAAPVRTDPTGTTTQPVSLASVPSHAVTNAGTFAVQSAATQSGTWTVQPGNTANSTAWLVTGTGGTFPVTGTFWQATQPVSLATLPALVAGTANIGDVDVASVPADPFGANADAGSATGSISAKLRFIASTGIPITGTVTVGSHAVTNAGTFAVQAASTQSGTWTVQPGNTANSTAWLVTGTGGTFPAVLAAETTKVIGTINIAAAQSVTANAGTNLNTSALATSANLTAGTAKTQIVDGSGNVIASTSNKLNVDCGNCSGTSVNKFVTVTSTRTRPADTAAYAANDALSDSTSAPTALTFTSVVDATGKSGVITGLVAVSSVSAATPIQGELWLFDTAPTAVNDNAAFTISDAEYATVVAKIPFAMDSVGGSGLNTGTFVSGVNQYFTTVGSANLTGLVKVLNAYTPASAEVITFRLKVLQVN